MRGFLFLALTNGAEGLCELVKRSLELGMLDDDRLFGPAAQEDDIVEDRAGFKLFNGVAHGVETFQAEGQPLSHFLAAWFVLIQLFRLWQQEARFHEGKP